MADNDQNDPVPAEANGNIRTYKGITYDITDPKYQGLSKNGLKRLLKEEHWNATREKRNKFQKDKKKQKSAERRKLIEEGVIPAPPPKRPRLVEPSSVRVAIDCSFTSYMHETEIKSLQAQLVRCHSANRTGAHPMQITVTSFDDVLKGAFEKKTPSYNNWKNCEFTSESYLDKFDASSLVYLSADSDNVVRELEDDKVYIIGGIVDKNRHKGLCQNKAAEQGIATAALPIGEYLHMASRKVLTVNHVYEIMIKWLDNRDWEKAFLEVIPGRKLKDSKRLGESEAESDEKEPVVEDKTTDKADPKGEEDPKDGADAKGEEDTK
ncbi:guanine-1-methyltransferase-domain-containing protein [Fennellomyces sp. T-0311]|nr:guanine-1-methyltransferase-domain-containing protein [Fennellomyces sp. T-0311]